MRGAVIALAAGTVAVLALLLEQGALFVGGFIAHKVLLVLASFYLWGGAYLLVHRSLVFMPAVLRPLCVLLWQVVWSAVTLPFLLGVFFVGPDFGHYVTIWEDSARRFTYVTAAAHFLLLLGERFFPSPDRPASAPVPMTTEVGLADGLMLAMPAIFVSWISVFLLQDAIWIVGGVGGGLIVKAVLFSVPSVFGSVLYLAVYLLLGKVRPLCRPLWAPLWGLGWFILAPLCVFLFYAAFMGLMAIIMAYAFTCLTAWFHYLLMLAWAGFIRVRAA